MIEGWDYKIPVTFIIVGNGNMFLFIEQFCKTIFSMATCESKLVFNVMSSLSDNLLMYA